jgi:hypothetical protein
MTDLLFSALSPTPTEGWSKGRPSAAARLCAIPGGHTAPSRPSNSPPQLKPSILSTLQIRRRPTRRVEHWVVAERQGQTAALNMLGHREKFAAVPFFWSQHYDVPINYVGHAEKWDELAVDGDVMAKDCMLRYKRNGRVLAAASIYRDIESLETELATERNSA